MAWLGTILASSSDGDSMAWIAFMPLIILLPFLFGGGRY